MIQVFELSANILGVSTRVDHRQFSQRAIVVSFGVELRSSDIDVGSLGVIHGKDDHL